MEIKIPQEVSQEIEKASKDLGMKRNELISRAVRSYLKKIKKQSELDEEINAWENATIKDSQF